MEKRYYKEYSYNLGRDMEFVSYGENGRGKPIFLVPSQAGKFYDWENFGMIDNIRDYIDSGKVQLFSFDTIDQETVSAMNQAPYDRVRRHEAWYNYVIEELVPRACSLNNTGFRPAVCGVSMGAYHAANFFFRRPDIFDGLIAMSGLYDCQYMYGDYMDEYVYNNSPAVFLWGMPQDHEWIRLYNRSRAVVCVGQGAWEDEMAAATRRLDQVLKAKGINVWVDYWGHDVNHDWPWWKKQMRYFLPYVLGGEAGE